MKADADPNLIVYFGGQYVPMREARVGILTHALHYGTGVFEGHSRVLERGRAGAVRSAAHGALPALEAELRNSAHRCAALAEELCAITAELARRNAFHTDLYIRPLAYKSAERIGVAIDDQDAFFIVALPLWRISAQRERAACRRQLLAAHRGQCHSAARQDLRRLRQQRAGQRRRAAQRIRRSHFAERKRPRDRGRHLQPFHGAQREADHARRDRQRA